MSNLYLISSAIGLISYILIGGVELLIATSTLLILSHIEELKK